MNYSNFQETKNDLNQKVIVEENFTESENFQTLEYLYEFNKYPQTHPEYQAILFAMIVKDKLYKRLSYYYSKMKPN